jgi:hypothetical protein
MRGRTHEFITIRASPIIQCQADVRVIRSKSVDDILPCIGRRLGEYSLDFPTAGAMMTRERSLEKLAKHLIIELVERPVASHCGL